MGLLRISYKNHLNAYIWATSAPQGSPGVCQKGSRAAGGPEPSKSLLQSILKWYLYDKDSFYGFPGIPGEAIKVYFTYRKLWVCYEYHVKIHTYESGTSIKVYFTYRKLWVCYEYHIKIHTSEPRQLPRAPQEYARKGPGPPEARNRPNHYYNVY